MNKRIRIKDIAQMAGVSPGTVDRVIHNRGNIAPDKKKKIEEILEKVGYQPNIHLSSISTQKEYKIAILIPSYTSGEYWEYIKEGVERAIKTFDAVKVKHQFFLYDQYNIYSFAEVLESFWDFQANGVILDSTFTEQAIELTRELDQKEVPYIFVDSMIQETNPLACFSTDHHSCGYLMAKLIDLITPSKGEVALFQVKRIGAVSANTTMLRKKGFLKYFEEKEELARVVRTDFSVSDPKENEHTLRRLYQEHPQLAGVVTLSSKGYIIANLLHQIEKEECKLICMDLTRSNYSKICSNEIDFVISQKPGMQGYEATKRMIEFFLYQKRDTVEINTLPLDIITRENADTHWQYGNN